MAAPESDDGARPWADLPVEMVDTIVQHLDLFSTTRLASVCTSWATAVAANAALPFGAPCLLMTSEEEDDENYHYEEEWSYQLMDLTRGRGDVSFPALVRDLRGQWWVGGKDDWLAVVDEHGSARLLNPYTFHQIDLPRIATGDLQDGRAFHRIVVCETPSDAGDKDNGGYLVIGMAEPNLLAIARGGDVSWTVLRNPQGRRAFYKDAIVHKGKVFAVESCGCIYSWDIRDGGACPADPEELRPPPDVDCGELRREWESLKLAESTGGHRLLLACTYGRQVQRRRFSINSDSCKYVEFAPEGVRLYERDVDAGDGWSPVTSLGDHSLFLGANYPFLARVVDQVCSSDSDQQWQMVRPNCVCFAEDQLFRSRDYDVQVFDLGDVEHPYNPYKLLWSDSRYKRCYQVPIWFRPILRIQNYDLE